MHFFERVLEIQKNNLRYKIQNINKNLNLKNKNLVFIGTIGVGKTSAICSLFNLYDRSDNFEKPILQTGSGATTICEVIIEFGNKFELRIDPYSKDELEKLIKEYVDTLIGPNIIVDGQNITMSAELVRAIKYMISPANMNLRDIDNFINEKIENNFDYNSLLNEFLENANLNNRQKIVFENERNISNEKWLREEFYNLNMGKNPNASIPKKIFITIISEKNNENKIIDTKGIDSSNQSNLNFLREDLERYILNPDNIIIFCSSFLAAPDTDIIHSISYYVKRDPEIIKRFILLVIPKNEDPKNVAGVDHDSIMPSYNQGLQIREQTIRTVLNGRLKNIPKILFHNFTIRSEIEFSNCKLIDILKFQDEIYDNYKNELMVLQKKMENLNKGDYSSNQRELIDLINVNLNKLQSDLLSSEFNAGNFIKSYINTYSSRYPAANTKNAIHVRWGSFNSKNIYFDYEKDLEDLFYNFFTDLNTIAKIQKHLGLDTYILANLIPEINENIVNNFRILISSLTKELRKMLEENTQNDVFWRPLIIRWGLGPGYNNDILNILNRNFNALKLNNKIEEKFRSEWQILVNKFISQMI